MERRQPVSDRVRQFRKVCNKWLEFYNKNQKTTRIYSNEAVNQRLCRYVTYVLPIARSSTVKITT